MQCGGFFDGNVTVQWAKSRAEYDAALDRIRALNTTVDIRHASGLPGRWRVMRDLITSTSPDSILDVGGFGEYRTSARVSHCINIHPHRGCDVYAPGTSLPYRTGRYDTVLLETVLHHAAEHAIQVIREATRVARRHVIIAEDVLDRRASHDVVASYRRHDPWAIYRDTSEWVALANFYGLRILRLVALHRVPLHIARETRAGCTLGFPPMQYLVFSKHVDHL